MRHTIETAPKDGKFVILEDDASGSYDVAHWEREAGEWIAKNSEPSKITPTHWHPLARDKYLLRGDELSSRSSRAGRSVWRRNSMFAGVIAAAALLALYVSRDAKQNIAGIVAQFVSQAMPLPGQNAKAPSLVANQSEANRAFPPAEGQQAAPMQRIAVVPPPEARQPLRNGPAETVAQELAEARRALGRLDVQRRAESAKNEQLLGQEREKMATLTREATAAREELQARTAQHRQALDDERTRRANELEKAQREIVAQAAQLRRLSDESEQFKQAEAARNAQSRGQERETTAAIALEAAAARQKLTTRTAQHRQALEEEHARRTALANQLATAQRKIEEQTTQLRKLSDETGQLKQVEVAKSEQLLGQEREKAAALAREAAAARQELTASLAQNRQALDEERARRTTLTSELSTAQREIETQAARLLKLSDETRQFKQAEAAKSEQLIGQEREKAAALAREAAAARQEMAASLAQHRQALDEERARSTALGGELAAAQREVELRAAQLRKARDDAGQFQQATGATIAELRQALQQERDRTALMSGALEAAQRTVDTHVAPGPETTSQTSRAVQQPVEVTAMTKPTAAEAQTSPEATRLIARASVLLFQGDIGSARIVLERAVEMGSARASFMLAETYDPVILSTWGTYGTRGEVTRARELYAKAHTGGIQEAKDRFEALPQ